MATTDLSKQVEAEAREIAEAPTVPSAGLMGRCHFCGALTRELLFVERVGEGPDEQERFRGVDCCGGA